MNLADFSEDYREFYAPMYAIRIARDDLVRDLLAPVSQVDVDLQLGTASRFSFTVVESYSHKDAVFRTETVNDLLQVLKFGTEVEISMGYSDLGSDPKRKALLASGIITEISTNFPEGGSPELSIGGYDHGFPLTIGQHSRTWSERFDSDVAEQIASFNNLGSVIKKSQQQHPQIEQNQEHDWAFLVKLAERNDYELYVDEQKNLHFAPPQVTADPVVTLKYGEGLLTFKPEANLARQISRVEVYGWDRNKKETIVGVATAGEELGLKGNSPGEILNGLVRDPAKKPTLRLRQPVFSQAEANQRAKAALNASSREFLTGEGESIGLPELRPDRRIELTNLGETFSKPYYIHHATHKIDANGYRTRFKVKEPGAKVKKKSSEK